MILEEVIGIFVSLSATVITHAPSISRENRARGYSLINEEQEEIPQGVIHREYDEENESIDEPTLQPILIHRRRLTKRTVCTSILRSLQANIGLLMGVVLLGLFNIALVYVDLKTSNSCIEWKYFNLRIPSTVKFLQTTGMSIASFPMYTWFAISLAMLWGFEEFKRNYISCLYVTLIAGAISMAYKIVLGKEKYEYYIYRVPSNIFFMFTLLFGVSLVTRKFRKVNPGTSYSFCRIVFTLLFTFIIGAVLSYIYMYVIIAQFNKSTDTFRTIITALSPGLVVLPIAIGKYLVLRKSSEIIPPDRAYVLCYFLRGAIVVLFRTMQADFQNIWIFIGLSLVHGFSNVLTKATLNLRVKVWKCFIRCVNRTGCGSGLKVMPLDRPRVRCLGADLEIQNILFEYTTVILSQVYLTLYLVWNFDIHAWQIIQRGLIRIAISLAIDFFFNIVSVFIEIHFRDFPIRRVWLKHWRRHLFANALFIMVIVASFGGSLVSVFEAQKYKSNMYNYKLRNCTASIY